MGWQQSKAGGWLVLFGAYEGWMFISSRSVKTEKGDLILVPQKRGAVDVHVNNDDINRYNLPSLFRKCPCPQDRIQLLKTG